MYKRNFSITSLNYKKFKKILNKSLINLLYYSLKFKINLWLILLKHIMMTLP